MGEAGHSQTDDNSQTGAEGAHVWRQTISLSDPRLFSVLCIIATAGLLAGILALAISASSEYGAGHADAKAEDAKTEVHDAVDKNATEQRLVLQALIRIEAKIDAQQSKGDSSVKRAR